MTWLRKAVIGTERTLFLNTVRLCFAPTFTKKQFMKYGKEANEIAARLKKQGSSFLESKEWKDLRRIVVKTYGRKCMKCGSTPKNPTMTHVDHIKPRKTHPELALNFDNLQVLCCKCNKAKGNKHQTDYRKLQH
jgi:predicted restriction endonuclease